MVNSFARIVVYQESGRNNVEIKSEARKSESFPECVSLSEDSLVYLKPRLHEEQRLAG